MITTTFTEASAAILLVFSSEILGIQRPLTRSGLRFGSYRGSALRVNLAAALGRSINDIRSASMRGLRSPILVSLRGREWQLRLLRIPKMEVKAWSRLVRRSTLSVALLWFQTLSSCSLQFDLQRAFTLARSPHAGVSRLLKHREQGYQPCRCTSENKVLERHNSISLMMVGSSLTGFSGRFDEFMLDLLPAVLENTWVAR